MDPRSGAGIDDAAGAVFELPQAAEHCADLLAAREVSVLRLAELATKIDASLLPERSSLVMFGRLIDQGLTTALFESSLSEIAKTHVAF